MVDRPVSSGRPQDRNRPPTTLSRIAELLIIKLPHLERNEKYG